MQLITALALAAALAPANQDPMMGTPPKELKALSFMSGTFDVDFQMFEPGSGQPAPMKGTITTGETLNGMWIESKHESEMGGMPMKGLQMTTFDPMAKEYVAYWFDSMGPQGMEMRGKLNGQTLVLLSKPMEIMGMPGKSSFRATSSMKGVGKYLFRLEINSGKGWGKFLEGMCTKK